MTLLSLFEPYCSLSSSWENLSSIQYDSHPGQCWSCQYPQCRTCDNAVDPHSGRVAHSGHQPAGCCRLASVNTTLTHYKTLLKHNSPFFFFFFREAYMNLIKMSRAWQLLYFCPEQHMYTQTHIDSQVQCWRSSNKTDDVLSFECAHFC